MTVLIPVYNRVTMVAEAIDSALEQKCPGGVEVLVVDDGSDDGTPDVLAGYGDRIRVLSQDNQGPAVARNNGFAQARGEVVALLDSDDIWLPDKLASQLALLDLHPEVALAHSEVEEFFEDGRATPWTRRPPVLSGIVLRPLLRRNFIHTMTVMLRKTAFREVKGFDPVYPPCEDWDLWLRIAERWSVIGDPTPRVRTRIHDGGISSDPIITYQQACRVLAAAARRLKVTSPQHAPYARKQAARWYIKLGRRLERAGKKAEADMAFRNAVDIHPAARLRVLQARMFKKS